MLRYLVFFLSLPSFLLFLSFFLSLLATVSSPLFHFYHTSKLFLPSCESHALIYSHSPSLYSFKSTSGTKTNKKPKHAKRNYTHAAYSKQPPVLWLHSWVHRQHHTLRKTHRGLFNNLRTYCLILVDTRHGRRPGPQTTNPQRRRNPQEAGPGAGAQEAIHPCTQIHKASARHCR